MEKTTIKQLENNITNENISLINRKNLKMTGILEIISSSENGIYLKVKDNNLTILGNNIHITKLDIENKILEAEGVFESFKYGKSNIFKRIFK